MTVHSTEPAATPVAHRNPRTAEEIAAITRYQGEAIWIENLESAGEFELVDTLFEYHDRYPLADISSAFYYVDETQGSFDKASLTTALLDKITVISEGLLMLMSNEACGKWSLDEYRNLLLYFIPNFSEWDIALGLIETRRINKYKQLMELLPQAVEGSSKALLDGTL